MTVYQFDSASSGAGSVDLDTSNNIISVSKLAFHEQPAIPVWRIAEILRSQNINDDLHRCVKEESLSLRPNAARLRAEKTISMVAKLAQTILPLTVLNRTVQLDPSPVLFLRHSDRKDTLVLHTLEEPMVRFDHQHESKDIRDGIAKFGAYEEQWHGDPALNR